MAEKNNRKVINAWAMYDWANSSYPLVITTAIFPIFFDNVTSTTLPDGTRSDLVQAFGTTFRNSELFAYVSALSFLIIAFTSPMLSGIADYSGAKKKFLMFFCILGAVSCGSLFFFNADNLGLSMLSVLFASIGYWGSIVFYNAFLPEISKPEDHDRVSAKGFALGYLGSSLLLILCLIMIKNPSYLGLSSDQEVMGYSATGFVTRLSFILVAIWWIGFAQLAFRRLPGNLYNRKPSGNILLKGFREIRKVWEELKEQPRLKRYLIAFFFYSMGVQTVMLMAVLFAKKEVAGMKDSDLIVSVLLIQFIGIAGSYLFSFVSSKFGNIITLCIANAIWILLCIGVYQFVYAPQGFYIAAATVGLIMGGIQALSRSTYSKLLPETIDHASYFSFYDVCEKLGIVIGTFSFGYIEGFTGSMRNSILALITFFVIGFILLLTVPKNQRLQAPALS